MTEPTMSEVGAALRTIANHAGPTFTGSLAVHIKDGTFQVLEYPPVKLTADQLKDIEKTDRR